MKTVVIALFLSVTVDVSEVEETSENREVSFPQTEGTIATDFKYVILFWLLLLFYKFKSLYFTCTCETFEVTQ